MHYERYFRGSGRFDFVEKKWAKKNLTAIQYEVTQNDMTEPPFKNPYYNHKEEGIYVDIVSKEPLFSSKNKFDSGCGWTSFSKAIDKDNVMARYDYSHGMKRAEVRSKEGDSHLGHMFEYGPIELGGIKFCINSASLEFIPKDKMEERGYKEFLKFV